MKIPLQITVRNVSLSGAAETDIREKAANLDQFYPDIMGCRVVVDAPHRHHQHGFSYIVTIDITVPGSELVIRREPHEDLYVAIRDAFEAAERQLKEFNARQRGDVKTHENHGTAEVAKIFSFERYGFLMTSDGREIYFHEHAVRNNGFDRLTIGTKVRFTEEMGDKGPQASYVTSLKSGH